MRELCTAIDENARWPRSHDVGGTKRADDFALGAANPIISQEDDARTCWDPVASRRSQWRDDVAGPSNTTYSGADGQNSPATRIVVSNCPKWGNRCFCTRTTNIPNGLACNKQRDAAFIVSLAPPKSQQSAVTCPLNFYR
jgi:hypothetical protein